MPTKLSYSGREYANPTGCPVRLQTPLRAGHSRRVGTVPELFGAAVPIYAAGSHRPADPAEIAIIAKPGSSCYVVYGLQGGP